MHARLTRPADYLRIDVTGVASLDSLLDMVKTVSAQTRARGDTRVLVNLAMVEGELNFTGHFLLGEHVALHLSHLSRIASVVRPEQITRTSERVARAQGVQLSVFGSEPQALAWLLATDEPAAEPADVRDAARLDPVRSAFWQAFSHLFPRQAQAIQLVNGHLVIAWPVGGDQGAVYEMSTPITVRFEPGLIEQMRLAGPEQRKRLASQQEAALRAGLVGYDPYAKVPKARVIVLG